MGVLTANPVVHVMVTDTEYRLVLCTNLKDLHNLPIQEYRTADAVIIKGSRRLRKTELRTTFYRAHKDRYGSSGRMLTSEERERILRNAEQIVYHGPMV